ncbi:Do family serine endopeptidase [Devosia sp.]|uniref:Do family serine endopeptidase n=1 Tax=Devosia sp. TaxID=1871048 RepID=UPI003A911BFC
MAMRTVWFVAAATAVVIGGGAVITTLATNPNASAPPAVPGSTPIVSTAIEPQPPVERVVPKGQGEVLLSFAPVVKSVTPSVVNVYATTISQQSASPFGNDPFFERFFGGNSPFSRSRPRKSQSLGSGVIVDAGGVILTNHHVIDGATDIRVATTDGTEYAVDLVLDDPKTDLAVLKVQDAGGTAFPAVQFADSDQLEVGDMVLAIGNPFGVGQTVTSGIVSALARTGVEPDSYEFFIQTDAAINPGNSGGALVDLQGRLVGVNTAIVSRSGGSVGIGFAIPANMAKLVAETGVAGGSLVRPWFGARLQPVSSDIANSIGLGRPQGALIAEMAPGGPADQAGFRDGDVILAVDGFDIDQPSAFDFRLATKQVGASAVITFFRGGREASITLPLTAAPDAGAPVSISGNTRFAGTTVATVTPALAQELGLGFDTRGVVIREVERNSPADDLGLRVGDLILSLNETTIADAESFERIANDRPRSWRVVLQRGGRTIRAEIGG